MRISLLFLILLMIPTVHAQHVSYEKHPITKIPKWKEVTVSQEIDPYMVSIEPVIAPDAVSSPEKKYLKKQKAIAQKKYPRQSVVRSRSALEVPEVLNDFSGNNWISATPLDNHIAFSLGGQILSTVNVHMVVMNETGFWLSNRTLSSLFEPLTNVDRFFDPRVMYDPVEDRWIMVLMNGVTCEDTELLFAFSKTNDATDGWNLYKVKACPFADNTFADFPMISLVGNELFFTLNAVDQDASWQVGFVETLIWQIDKFSGYAGADLDARMWSDVKLNGRNIRNLCPVKNATEELPSEAFFLSNRNFDIENDSIFILEITGDLDDPTAELLIDVHESSQPYGVPPNALQPIDTLQTNDARILDAFLLDEHIQFVGNTMDFASGKSAVYYGVIENVYSTRDMSGTIISGGDDELGYPGLAYTGIVPGDRDAIIIASHASEIRNPGFSGCYVDGYGNHSDWVTVKEGQKPIDMFDFLTVERWGDYCGVQRIYHQPGKVYASASYGRYDRSNNTWVGLLARPEVNVSVDKLGKDDINVKTYPNPSTDWFEVSFVLESLKDIKILLYHADGKFEDKLAHQTLDAGAHILRFNLHTLKAGTYIVQIEDGNTIIAQQKVIKQ
jgi:hypothetical protein